MHDDVIDLAQQALQLKITVQALQIGNTILRAQIEELQRQVAAAERRKKYGKKYGTKAAMPA